MDPNVTLDVLQDSIARATRYVQRAEDGDDVTEEMMTEIGIINEKFTALHDWMRRGGHPPRKWSACDR